MVKEKEEQLAIPLDVLYKIQALLKNTETAGNAKLALQQIENLIKEFMSS